MRRVLFLAVLLSAVTAIGSASSAPRQDGPQCGDVLTGGVVVLTQDLVCSGDGLVVESSADLTLDLKGHSISGDGTGIGIRFDLGDPVGGSTGPLIENGVIRSFDTGVSGFASGHAAELSDLTIRENGLGVLCRGTGPFIVAGSVVASNGDGGVRSLGCAARLTNDQILNNGGPGIAAFQDSMRLLQDSLIAHNGSYGASFADSVATISGNTFLGNGAAGLLVTETFCELFSSYVVSNNAADGNAHGGMIMRRDSALPPCAANFAPSGTGNAAKNNGDFQCILIVCARNRGQAT
jgi:parallel beta helix pectate lyase-like protein